MLSEWIAGLEASQLRRQFDRAVPFRHVVLQAPTELLTDFVGAFPDADWVGWKGLGDSYQKNKFACNQIEILPAEIQVFLHDLCKPTVLTFLEKLTGIDGLIPDPYLEGGGLHLSLGGGILAPHTDFHIYDRLALYRRINLILYLNSEWESGDGGELELSLPNSQEPEAVVRPTFGSMVIFETDDRSVHGFRNPVKEGTSRRSVALYYYTARDSNNFSGDQTTHWREHARQNGIARVRFVLSRGLLRISRLFSIAAHIANPNQGIRLLRQRLHRE